MENTLRSSIQDARQGITKIVKGELHLAVGEAKQTVQKVVAHSRTLAIAGGIGVIAGIFMLTFFFWGLSAIFDGNYWLSALILTVVFGGVAAVLGFKAMKKLKHTDMKLPITRESLRSQQEALPSPIRGAVVRLEERMHKVPEPKKTPDDTMYEAKLEVAEGQKQLHHAIFGFTETRKDFAEVGRNIAALNPAVTRSVKTVGPIVGVLLPALTLGYLGSKRLQKRRESKTSSNALIGKDYPPIDPATIL